MTEAKYQAGLIKRIKQRFPGVVVMKNDSARQQGILDLTLLFKETWAMLEVKIAPGASRQPNQEFFVHQLDEMSFAAFIYPENEVEVLDALQQAFASRGRACVSQP